MTLSCADWIRPIVEPDSSGWLTLSKKSIKSGCCSAMPGFASAIGNATSRAPSRMTRSHGSPPQSISMSNRVALASWAGKAATTSAPGDSLTAVVIDAVADDAATETDGRAPVLYAQPMTCHEPGGLLG